MPGCRILSRFHTHTHTHTHTHACTSVRMTEIMSIYRTGRRNSFCYFRIECDGCITGREQTIRTSKHCQEVCETASVHCAAAQFGERTGRYNNHYVGMEEW